jgi:hypothetical protein
VGQFQEQTEWILQYLVGYNLTGDAQLVSAFRDPFPAADVERHVVNPPLETDERPTSVFRRWPFGFAQDRPRLLGFLLFGSVMAAAGAS